MLPPSTPRSLRRPLAAAAILALGAIVGGGLFALNRPATPEPSSAALLPSPSSSELDAGPTESPSASPIAAGPFAEGVLIADRANGRILAVADDGRILWRFPASPIALPAGQKFTADDAFISPDGRSVVANDEFHEVIDRIDIATGQIVWQYGRYNRPGAGTGQLHTPDDAYPLANGDIVVADIENCRILEIAPDKSIVRQWGRTGACRHRAGVTFGRPNGDTPLPDGGLLITEIIGSRVVRLAADGHVVFDIHVPVAYPSDAQLDRDGNIVVADFSTLGQVVCVDPTGRLVWRWAPPSGAGRLNHPSLATPMPSGLVSINDDFRHRVIVIDPLNGTIVWQYGHTGHRGTADGYLNSPDGQQPFATGIFQ